MTSVNVPVPKISSTRLNSKRPTSPQLRAPSTTSASQIGSVRLIISIASSCSRATDCALRHDVRCRGRSVTGAPICKGSCSPAQAIDPLALRRAARPGAGGDQPAVDPDAVDLEAQLEPKPSRRLEL